MGINGKKGKLMSKWAVKHGNDYGERPKDGNWDIHLEDDKYSAIRYAKIKISHGLLSTLSRIRQAIL